MALIYNKKKSKLNRGALKRKGKLPSAQMYSNSSTFTSCVVSFEESAVEHKSTIIYTIVR